MNKVKKLLAAVIFLTAFSAFGQTGSEKQNEQPYIEVTGTAEMEVVPDEIYIAITIREKYVSKTKITVEEQETKLKESVKSIGVDLENLTLSDANASHVKVAWRTQDVLTKKNYTLKVSDATTVGKVFQELEKLEITGAHISRVSYSKLDSLKKEIRIKAIKDAKEKADYLLEAIGEQTGKPLYITDNTGIQRLPTRSAGQIAGLMSGVSFRGSRIDETAYYIDGVRVNEGASSEIEFQKIKIQETIYVQFSIK